MSCARKQSKPKQPSPAKENIHHSPDKITKRGGSYVIPQGTRCSQLGGVGQQTAIWVQASQEARGTVGLSWPLFAFAPKAAPGAAVGPRHPVASAPRTPCLDSLLHPSTACSLPAAADSFCPGGSPISKDTNFVFYRSVSGLRANLGRRPIFPIFLSFSSGF